MDKQRVRGEKEKMKNFKQLRESIIDIPRRTYAPGVFDEADTENPKIKSSVKKLIDDQLKDFEAEYPVLKVSLIGSILTKRYRNDADLDINVLFDVPKEKQEDERVRLSQKYLSAKNPDNIQGKEIPGTKHPINFYFITDKETYDSQNKKADAVFDIENNKFIKRPDDFVFDPDLYVKEFERKVQELDVVKGELKRDIIDYNELKELTPNDVLNLQEKIKDKLEEIEDSLEQIVKIGDGVDADRRAAFDKDMSPDEIRQFGVKNRLPKNVIYKMLEKYHYLKFYKKCKKILDDGEVTDAEIDSLKTEAVTLDSIKKAAQRFAKGVYDKLKRMATTKQRYEYAAKVLQDVIDRKEVERAREGLPLRHDIGYYAAAVADTFHDIDPKKLVTMVKEDLYSDDNPSDTVKGTGYGDEETARKSLNIIKSVDKQRQMQIVNTLYNRAKHHANQTAGMRAAMSIFKKWIEDNKQNEMVTEAAGKSVAFAFGRFNPPTIGHEKLIRKVASTPANDYRIFLSRSEDAQKNPLSPQQKLTIMKKMFPQHASKIMINKTNMVLDLATDLYNKGFREVKMIAGSDRVREFETILKKYNDQRNRHGYYNFDKIEVVSAGERDPDAEGATGMSASKMRAAAAKGDLNSFKQGLPRGVNADDIMKQVRKGMKLAASYAYDQKAQPIANLEQFEQQQIRDLYIREIIFNIGDKVDYVKENVEGKVVRKSTNYIVVEDTNGNLHKAWIWDCIPKASDKEIAIREYNLDVDYGFKAVSEKKDDGHTDSLPQDRDVKKQKGTQPKKYYKDLSKSEKEKRAAHFRSTDTTKNVNTPAPGDKDTKTKPSKHTQKFKKMFGELKVDLADACWKGYKQVGMKNKNGKQVPNCVPEAYEIGADWANHTKEITPGETPDAKPKPVGSQADDEKKKKEPHPGNEEISKKDIEEWAAAGETIHKYRERYGEDYQKEIEKTKTKMLSFKDYVEI
jgi:predicted nucleotidyltransferase